jgi:NADH:ubiquinone oxidoreductase subunit 5 (subunit L)/multisubunit Na+/H+ antiporter MnhA subunit
LDFYAIFACIHLFKDSVFVFFWFKIKALDLISLFLFIAAVGKSAQLGLHT